MPKAAQKGPALTMGAKKKAAPGANTGAGKARGLTLKQKKLVKGVAEGKTQKEAAKAAGLNEQYASDILKKPEVRATIQDLMEGMGLSDSALLIKHKELLNAQKQISGVKDADGGSLEFIEVPDYMTQMKALDSAYKLKGAFIERKEITGAAGAPLFDQASVKRIAKLIVEEAGDE